MKHFVKTDSMGVVNGYTYSDMAPSGWIELETPPGPDLMVGTKKRLVNGAIVDTGQGVTPPAMYMDWSEQAMAWVPSVARAWEAARIERNKRLTESDWATLPDVPMADDVRAAWATYRQALRDITDQPDPLNLAWPEKPG